MESDERNYYFQPSAELEETLRAINPHSNEAITLMPLYMFANCNQANLHPWTPVIFQKFREKAHSSKNTLQQQTASFDNKKRERTFELYDWIYGIALVESNYLHPNLSGLSIQDLHAINSSLTRLCKTDDAVLRDSEASWDKYDLTPAELTLRSYIDTELVGNIFLELEDPFLDFDRETNEITSDSIKRLLRFCKRGSIELRDIDANGINIDEVSNWENEKSYSKTGVININEWKAKRVHTFPASYHLHGQLEKMMCLFKSSCNNSTIHPILLAAMIWFEIIRIHPWNAAHKRTGKVIASIILMKHGYLPPIITQAKEFDDVLQKAIYGGKTEYENFVQFIARSIKQTQEAYINKPLDSI